MSEIALYNLLKRIPDATDEEVEKAVADVARKDEVATKSDIADIKTDIADIKTDIAKLETSITWRLVVGLGIVVAILKLL